MNTNNNKLNDHRIILPRKAIDEMSNDAIVGIILGKEPVTNQGTARMRRVRVIIALCLWVSTLTLVFELGASDSLNKLMRLSTLGLLLVLFGKKFSSYTGPTWPIIGRLGQRINKPTPYIFVVFFGWILLTLMLLILSVMFIWK